MSLIRNYLDGKGKGYSVANKHMTTDDWDKMISIGADKLKRDSLGRRNTGFSHINSHGLNAASKRVKEFNTYFSLMTTKNTLQRLSKAAKKRGITKAELVRIYIEWGLENDKI